ncbi:type VII secretion protein EccE [Stackebrandtia albiflava]|uniref:Type VII secretion protein EccE n=1 Tax=Stackebrandtia albiflava TaxID=406432 RepID=A0A562UPV0_9ACTN|nr:type VII secretion protein EccE [Stackebrandtia albiflava]TWJ07637.1 type VII secretion protein EccE [Stackebrandtia albiflava]
MTMVQAPAARGTAVVAEKRQRIEQAASITARNNGRLGPFGLIHLFVVEVVIGMAAGIYTVTMDAPTDQAVIWYAGGGVAALLLLVPVFARSGGVWLYQAIPMRRKLKARQRQLGLSQEPLHGLAPDLGIVGIVERDTDIGIGHDDGGWFAGLAMGGIDGVTEAVPLDRLARLFTESGVPVSAIQVVGHTVPIGLAGHDGSPAAASYQELLGGLPAVVHHTSWLAVRMNTEDAMDAATDRGGDVEGVHKALAVTVSRVGKLLRNAGVQNRVLDADGLRDTLRESLGLTADVAGGQQRTAEEWDRWHGDGLQHVVYRVAKWPGDESALPHLIDVLAAVPAVFTTVSVTLRPGTVDTRDEDGRPTGRRVEVDCLARIAFDAHTAAAGVQRVQQAAEALGARLERLDGEQGPAVYASAPTGGGT